MTETTLLFIISAAGGFLLGMLIQYLLGRNQLAKLESDIAVKDTLIKTDEARIAEQDAALSTVRESLMASFSELAHESLAKTNKAFLQLAEQNFDKHQTQATANLKEREQAVEHLVKPIKEALEKTTQQISEIEKTRKEAYGGISEQLKSMAQSHETLRSETSKLVSALRRPQVRGQWGEMTLRRLAELAGMVNHCDFSEQVHTTDEDNRGYRPDMIVRLPEKGQLVVDVKTPLDAYLDATEASDEASRKEALKRHATNVNARIKELSSKAYIEQFEKSPEFVILFVPGDQFLTAALDEKPTLLEDALAQKVLLATPTSLIALLKVVAYGWMQLNLADNAEEIKKLAIQMQDRLGTFTGHLTTVGARLNASVTSYNKAVASLETRVLPTTRKIRELGADSGKDNQLPESIDITARELKLIADDLKTDSDSSDTPDIEERPQ
ncbi:MAG: DNA recombination protein RmuC [Gammaproteobacteria bacterium]|nr:DNA recombination protein RmuC [Gammaproteobacteria bacterium]MCP4090861.1 DNA recombination protein RmuC [Gammaproteobacteria bacterium]MCP4275531.1 DNA recombination protein RmuC [Gammaproteobacteria bacterium]MCP4832253.1 DNA recombination protein RmuC [Gammaproteobacteria bacterium]MCP4930307.1 DNA recombination protein RmuC [Gammaproteobacteria bacterium]